MTAMCVHKGLPSVCKVGLLDVFTLLRAVICKEEGAFSTVAVYMRILEL